MQAMIRFALALVLAIAPAALAAQSGMEPVPARGADEGDGPYPALLVSGGTVIDGTGAPPVGPVDVLVEGNRIAALYPGGAPDAVRARAARVVWNRSRRSRCELCQKASLRCRASR